MSESNETKVEENMKVGWRNLGVAETIFEDEDEHEDDDEDEDEQSLSSPPLSFPLSSPSSPLQSGVDAWYVFCFLIAILLTCFVSLYFPIFLTRLLLDCLT